MKPLFTCVLLLGLAAPAFAIDKADCEKRIRSLTVKFDALQSNPEKRVPPEMLGKAQGIVLIDRTKAGFVFAFAGGGGVAMVKDAKSGNWSPPAFMRANEASLGLQVGGQQSFIVVLLMNTNAIKSLTDSDFHWGGEASGTAGDNSAKVDGTVPSEPQKAMLIYSDSTGLYGGVAVKGGDLAPDYDANAAYYSQSLSPREILFENKAKPTEATTTLAQKITQACKPAK
jgi:SH3 domain-containing YSC84-like protein 1